MSVQRIFISPNVCIALNLFTIVLFLDISIAPFASVEVIITGSISGVSPTAIVIAKIKASHQLPFVKKFIANITGIIITINFIKILLTLSTPLSKLFCSLVLYIDFAIFPKYVLLPIASTTAVARPLTIFVPVNPILDKCVNSAFFSLNVENFSTGLDSPVNEAWSINKSLVSRNLTSPGIMSPEESFRISPGTISSTSTVLGSSSLITSILFVISLFNFCAALFEFVC